jgi:hypothetical protein
MQATDFWGELGTTEVKTPLSIMREQAAALGRRTKNLVEARVETRTVGRSFVHSFELVVPSLDDYTYQLFEIRHELDLYPIDVKGTDVVLTTEEAFTAWLRDRLSSAETRRIVTNLLAQAQS